MKKHPVYYQQFTLDSSRSLREIMFQVFSCYPIVPMLRSKIVKAADFNVRSAVSHFEYLKAHVSSTFPFFPFIWDTGTCRCGLLLAGWRKITLRSLVLFVQVTDFHLDQHYGTAGPLGDFDYVGYYDYATCWNATNTAK